MVEMQLWIVRKAGEWSCRFGFCGGVGRRKRVCLHGHRGLGCVPDRWFFSVCFVSSKMAGGSAKSLLAMELRLSDGSRRAASGDGHHRRMLGVSAYRVSKGWFAFSLFSRDLCASRSEKLYSVSFDDVPVFVRIIVRFP